MLKQLLGGASMALALTFTAGAASAAVNLGDLPSNTYITVGDLDWTWASPVASAAWYGGNTLYGPELHAGWRYATDAELASRPNASAFLTDSGVIQSVQYWNSEFTHVDYSNGAAGLVRSTPDGSYYETWYVRDAAGAVPEPATWAMMIIGFGSVGSMVRSARRRAVLAA